jgi:hypothetical protein
VIDLAAERRCGLIPQQCMSGATAAQPAVFSFVLLNAPGRTRLAAIEIVVGAASHCDGPSPDGPAR